MRTIGVDILERFWSKVKIDSSDKCWEWNGGKKGGDLARGAFYYQGKSIHAHRFSWMLLNGEIPFGIQVQHTCDNGSCVNPNHLYLGTQSENLKDAFRRKRRDQHGENHTHNILNNRQVLEIRGRYESGDISQRALGEEYGVARTTIEHIVIGKNWRHI
jgi:hypothetical protein